MIPTAWGVLLWAASEGANGRWVSPGSCLSPRRAGTPPRPLIRATPVTKGRRAVAVPAMAVRAPGAREAMARGAAPAQATRVQAPEAHRAAAADRAAARPVPVPHYRCRAGMAVCPRVAVRVQARRPTPEPRVQSRLRAFA